MAARRCVDLPLDPSQASEEIKLPTLKDLENKILVKVDLTGLYDLGPLNAQLKAAGQPQVNS